MGATKEALEKNGFPAMTAYTYKVMGRGKQKGIIGEVSFPKSSIKKMELIMKKKNNEGIRYIPKRLIYMVVKDDQVDRVINTIFNVNQTGNHGDGKIFVCPAEQTIQIRTGEKEL